MKIFPSHAPLVPQRWMILVLGLLVSIAFHNSLQNDFIGDDKALFINNEFYKSLKNFPIIFKKDLIMDTERVQPSGADTQVSGIVSYRPMPAATFFLDYALWKTTPFGHHLTNVLLHFIAVILALYLVFFLTNNVSVAFLAAMLFATHPIQSEVVSSIGYRSDLLMTVFYLAALLFYIRHRQQSGRGWLWGCAGFYFLSLFSKESAMVFVPMLFLLDVVFFNRGWRDFLTWPRLRAYGFLVLITLFYGYVYFVAMPNQFYPHFVDVGDGLVPKLVVVLKIFANYLKVLILPVKITVLPPLYAPPIYPLLIWELFVPVLAILGGIVSAFYYWRRDPVITFAVAWFLLNYFPVSNVVPLLNPMAFRFMYLPSLGFFIIAAILIEKGIALLKQKNANLNFNLLIKVAIIGLNMALTIANNSFFKNDFVACHEMINQYPNSSRPYWILGLDYYFTGNPQESAKHLEQYLKHTPHNPFISDDKEKFMTYHLLGRVSTDPDVGLFYLDKARKLYPGFAIVYADIAQKYLVKRQYDVAIEFAQESLKRDPHFGYAYFAMIHAYIAKKDFVKAKETLMDARKVLGKAPALNAMENYLTRTEKGD